MQDQATAWGAPDRPATITHVALEAKPAERDYRRSAKPPVPGLALDMKWSRRNAGCSIPFLIFWFGFLGVWYWIALSGPEVSVASLVCPVMHVLLGLVLVVAVIGQFINTTRIELDEHGLRTRTRPLAAFRKPSFPLDEIDEVRPFVRQQQKTELHFVEVALTGGMTRPLLSTATREEADYIAWSINSWLQRHRGE